MNLKIFAAQPKRKPIRIRYKGVLSEKIVRIKGKPSQLPPDLLMKRVNIIDGIPRCQQIVLKEFSFI